jgi:D-alanyl-D-alanine carboxypeptidase (penicillin-binding protein 5/6)
MTPALRSLVSRLAVVALATPLAALILLVCTASASAAGSAAHARTVPPPRLAVTGASLIDASTGRVLWGIKANAELPIASTTKLMTALITLQHVRRLGTIFTQNDWTPAADDSQIGLDPGEKMSVHDLLVAMMLPSADDAAEDLAYNVGHHSVARFVAMMNAEARALHLTRTHYSTPIGLDTPGNYSSPTDLDLLAAYDRDHSPFFRRLVDTPAAKIHAGNSTRYVVNRNDLVGRYRWINGVKTGHTNDAGYVLVLSATRWGMTLISSVLGTSSEAARDANALSLIEYGFTAFHLDRAIRRNQVLARLPEQYSSQRAPVIALHPFSYVVLKTRAVHVVLHLPKQVTGPRARHTVVGEAIVYAGRQEVQRVRLVLARAVPAVSPVTKAARLLIQPSTLLWLALVVIVLAGYRARRRRHSRLGQAQAEERD